MVSRVERSSAVGACFRLPRPRPYPRKIHTGISCSLSDKPSGASDLQPPPLPGHGPWTAGRSRGFWLLRYGERMLSYDHCDPRALGGVLLSSRAVGNSTILLLETGS